MSVDSTYFRGKSILLTGALGMLAHDLVPRLHASGARLTLLDIRDGKICGQPVAGLDITMEQAVEAAIAATKPDWIINCAAYTAVDDAEKFPELAERINCDAVGILARAAKQVGSRLMHISTDYVFGAEVPYGELREPWSELAVCNPCGVYGRTKRMGEELLLEILPQESLLVRTSWLHGVYGPNFVSTMVRVARERDELKVVNDQIGSPTWTGWLAGIVCQLVASEARGIYHACSKGNISWFDFAKEIFAAAGLEHVRVLPQSTFELNRPAPRPAYSTLATKKLEQFLGQDVPSFRWGMQRHLQQLGLC